MPIYLVFDTFAMCYVIPEFQSFFDADWQTFLKLKILPITMESYPQYPPDAVLSWDFETTLKKAQDKETESNNNNVSHLLFFV